MKALRAVLVALTIFAGAAATVATPTPVSAQGWDGTGLGPAQVRELRRELNSAVSAATGARNEAASAGNRAAVSQSNLIRVGELLGLRQDAPPEEVISAAARWVEQDVENRQKLASLGELVGRIESGEIRNRAEQYQSLAKAAFDDGRLEDAEQALAELQSFRRFQQTDARQLWIEAVVARASLADQRRDHVSARRLLREFRTEEHSLSRYVQWRAVMQEATSYQTEDQWRPDNGLLVAAIDLLQDEALSLVDRTSDPDDWAETQRAVGFALMMLGLREVGVERLEAAVQTYQAALEARSRDRTPLDWAKTQFELGLALWWLGTRGGDHTRLEAAVQAYQAALQEWTREEAPSQWALAQSSLCQAHGELGYLANDKPRMREGILACAAALEEWPEERAPSVRAGLSTMLESMGSLIDGEHVPEYDDALIATLDATASEIGREKSPLVWAVLQFRRGEALAELGKEREDSAQLEAAVAAYEAALEILTQDLAPIQWAATQAGLADVLFQLGDLHDNSQRLDGAIGAYELSMLVRTHERDPFEWALTQIKLANIHLRMATLALPSGGMEHLEASAVALEASQQVFTRNQFPMQWALSQSNVGMVYIHIAIAQRNSQKLSEANEILRSAAAAFPEDASGLDAELIALQKLQIEYSMEMIDLYTAIFQLDELFLEPAGQPEGQAIETTPTPSSMSPIWRWFAI